jgi:metal-sulfur cluster biosynthetic enzyme
MPEQTEDKIELPEVDLQAAAGPARTTVAVEDVTEALKDVVDPELGINVVDLGLIYGVTVDDASDGASDDVADGASDGAAAGRRTAIIDMTLTSAACPLTDVIEDQTRMALEDLVDDFRINWVWMPPWGPEKITDDGREQLRALGFNV